MASKNRNPEIANQYRNWVYPEPIKDIDAWRKSGHYHAADPGRDFNYFWPDKKRQPVTILVAGCGTHEAATIAYTNRDCEVVGVDLSDSSLRYTRDLKSKHDLKNLEVYELDLQEVGSLGKKFDFVISTGVLHHLPDPVLGGRAIADVLAADGVMNLMLYGTSSRVGIYLLQEAFRAIELKQTQEDVDLMRGMLEGLPQLHAVQKFKSNSQDWKYDAGLVDLLLNPQDRSYSVAEIYDFAEQIGLKFRGWLDNGNLALDHFLLPSFPGYQRIKALPIKQQEIFVDNFFQAVRTHRFNLCHKNISGYEIDFADKNLPNWVPIPRHNVKFRQYTENENGRFALWSRQQFVVGIDLFSHAMFEAIDGTKTVTQCIEVAMAKSDTPPADTQEHAKLFLEDMWKRGHIYFRKA